MPLDSSSHLSQRCAVCGGAIRADTTAGHCPVCLLDKIDALPMNPGSAVSTQMADYDLEEIIGRGGMGVVWRARQRKLDRSVAIKFLASGGWASDDARSRMQAEARAVARLRHPAIVPIIDVGESENGPWLSMELVHGPSLAERLASGPIPPRTAAQWILTVAEGISHAHQNGVLHRDLKPGNILLEGGDQPRVTDFGLARIGGTESSLTRTGELVGSPAYLAPEYLSGSAPSEIGDVYALGATLYHALAGVPPFSAPTVQGILRQVTDADPASLRGTTSDVPADLDTIVRTCLEKLPIRRYASAQLLADDLRRFLQGHSIAARPVSFVERAWRWGQRRPAVAALLALLVMGTGMAFWGIDAARRANQRERMRAESSLDELQKRTSALQRAETNLVAANVRLTETVEQRQLERTEDLFDQGRVSEGLLSLSRLLEADPPSRLAAGRMMGLLLHQDVARLMEVPAYFFDKVIRVVATPDGRHGFAATVGGRLWHLQREKNPMTKELLAGGFRPSSLVSSRDGSSVAILHRELSNTVAVISAMSGVASPHHFDHGAAIRTVALSDDGRRLGTFGLNGLVKIWDTASGDPVGAPLNHGKPFQFSAILPEGDRAVVMSTDGALSWTDVRLNAAVRRQTLPGSPITAFALMSNGEQLAIGSQTGEVVLYETKTLRSLGRVTLLEDGVRTLTFSLDGSVLACATANGRIRLLRLPEGQPIREDFQCRVGQTKFVFSHDGQRIAVVDESSQVVVLETQTGRSSCQSLNHVERATDAAFLPPGNTLLSASAEGTVRTWDLRPSHAPARAMKVPGPDSTLEGSALSPSGRNALAWTPKGKLWHWNLGSLEAAEAKGPNCLLDVEGRIRFAEFSPDENWVMAGGGPRTVRLSQISSLEPQSIDLPHSNPPMCGGFSPDGSWAVIGTWTGEVMLWNLRDGSPGPKAYSHRSWVRSVAFSPDGLWVVSSSEDHTARIWSWQTPGAKPKTIQQAEAVYSVTVNPSSSLLGTACPSDMAALWNLMTGQMQVNLGHRRVSRILFSPDGTAVATALESEDVHFWDTSTGALRSRIPFQMLKVQTAAFSPDGRRFSTGNQGGIARLWDVASGVSLTPALQHKASVCTVAFFPDGLHLFTGSLDGTLRIWDLPVVPNHVPEWPGHLARLLAGELTDEEKQNPVRALNLWEQMEARLRSVPGNDSFAKTAHWFGDPLDRRPHGSFHDFP